MTISVIWWLAQSLPFLSIHSNHGFSHILGLQNPKLPGSRFWPRPMLHSSIRSRMVLPDTPGGNWNLPAPTGNGRTRCCWSDTYALAMIHGGLPRKRCQCLSDIMLVLTTWVVHGNKEQGHNRRRDACSRVMETLIVTTNILWLKDGRNGKLSRAAETKSCTFPWMGKLKQYP